MGNNPFPDPALIRLHQVPRLHTMRYFKSTAFRIGIQLFFWLMIFGGISTLTLALNLPRTFILRNLLIYFGIIPLLVANTLQFFPRYFLRRRYRAFALSVLGLMLVILFGLLYLDVTVFSRVLEKMEPPALLAMADRIPFGVPASTLPLSFIRFLFFSSAVLASTLLESIIMRREQDRVAAAMREERLSTEMRLLRNQVNPHFLFNTLNNIYGLALTRAENLPEVIMTVSEMLRYMLYECSQPTVPLTKEIEYIDRYLELHRMKDDNPLDLRFTYPRVSEKVQMVPLLLIPLVENACKHGNLEDTPPGFVCIDLRLRGNTLTLLVENSLSPDRPSSTSRDGGGLGIPNLRKRLGLHYPDRHHLDIRERKEVFRVELSLDLG